MRVQVFQHVAFETPGWIVEEVRLKGYSLETTALFNNSPLPAPADFDLLIIMGGPMSVHDEVEFPWLRAEKELIAAAIREGKKVLGICLGAQLIAEVCGGRVYRAAEKEIGWWPVTWMGGLETMEFHWHGETFDLPKEAVLLAATKACVNQAFKLGDKIMGVQFHPEVTQEVIQGMVDNEGRELEEAGNARYIQSATQILESTQRWIRSGQRDWLRQWL